MRTTVALALAFFGLSSFSDAQTSQPFTLEIAAVHETLHKGEPVEIDIKTTNTTSEDIKLSKSNPAMEYEFDVRDAQGRPAAETALLKRIKDTSHPFVIYRLTKEILKPHQSSTERVNMSDYFDLSVPNTYSIGINRQLPKPLGAGIVKSNTVVITITP